MAKRLLFIDDERKSIAYYGTALRRTGIEVLNCYNVDHFWDMADCDGLDLVVLDIMMPSGSRYSSGDTQNGTTTGLKVQAELEQKCPELPVVVLTNLADDDILSQIRRRRTVRDVVAKAEVGPPEFAQLVVQLFEPATGAGA